MIPHDGAPGMRMRQRTPNTKMTAAGGPSGGQPQVMTTPMPIQPHVHAHSVAPQIQAQAQTPPLLSVGLDYLGRDSTPPPPPGIIQFRAASHSRSPEKSWESTNSDETSAAAKIKMYPLHQEASGSKIIRRQSSAREMSPAPSALSTTGYHSHPPAPSSTGSLSHPVHPAHAAHAKQLFNPHKPVASSAHDPVAVPAPGSGFGSNKVTRRAVRPGLQPPVNPYASVSSSSSSSSAGAASGHVGEHRYHHKRFGTRPITNFEAYVVDDAYEPRYNRMSAPPFIPDSDYHLHVLRQTKRNKPFICPIFAAKMLAGFCWTGTLFLVFVGVLVDRQPLFIRGILPRDVRYNQNSRKPHIYYATTYSERLKTADSAYKAAFAYFCTGCICLCYAYNIGWWLKTRYQGYRDMPDMDPNANIPIYDRATTNDEYTHLNAAIYRYRGQNHNGLPAKIKRTVQPIVGWISHSISGQPWRNPRRQRRAEADYFKDV